MTQSEAVFVGTAATGLPGFHDHRIDAQPRGTNGKDIGGDDEKLAGDFLHGSFTHE